MPVKKDEDGHRYVEAEAEVPGSPEQVWQAIATGKGISSWFVPTTSDEREGGQAVASFGPGMDAAAKITKWNPPQSFTAESEEGPLKVATEWTVEARDGGTCTVRVIHRWFADTDDWDAQFEGHAYGWASSFFRILRLYLAHFFGQECETFQLTGFNQTAAPETWQTIAQDLKIDEKAQRVDSTPQAPELAGTIEKMVPEDREVILRLDRPAPGFAHLFVVPMSEQQTMVSLRFHLFGEAGAAAAADMQRDWNQWLAKRFPQEMPQ